MLAALTGVGLGWARGGRLGALGNVSIVNLSVLGIAVALVLVARFTPLPPDAARVLEMCGALAALVVLWQNRRHPWMLLVFFGLALNSLVMLLNWGRMPISGSALLRVAHGLGPAQIGGAPRYTVVGPATRLPLLGDVLPLRVGSVGTVLSPGDLLMGLGLAGFVQWQMRDPGRAGRSGPTRPPH